MPINISIFHTKLEYLRLKTESLKRSHGINVYSYKYYSSLKYVFLLLHPLALQPTVGFGLSNNVLPFIPICHQLSPPSHSQDLKISFYFLFPSFPGSSPSSRPFQFLSEDLFGHPILLPFSLGDLTSLSFALLSILLFFLICSSLLVLDSSNFSIPRFHNKSIYFY